MKNILFKLKQQHGITLIEILVALLVTGIITTLGLRVYLTQHKTYLWQEQLSEMNMNAQFAIQEINERISYAGYGIPEGPIRFEDPVNGVDNITYITASNTNPDTIMIIAKTPIHGTYGVMPQGVAGINVNPVVVDGSTDSTYHDGGVTYDSLDLMAGDFAVIVDGGSMATEICSIENVRQPQVGTSGPAAWVYKFNLPWAINYSNCSYMTKIEFYNYFLDTDSNNIMLVTRSDPDTVIVAENVDSLNFTYIYHLANGDTTLDTPIPFVPVKAINVQLTVRTARMKKDVYGSSSMDSTGSGGYSYLTLSNTIKIKNKGFRSICF